MPGPSDTAKLNREIDELVRTIDLALAARMSASDRRSLRSDIETAMQRLDELRNRLAG